MNVDKVNHNPAAGDVPATNISCPASLSSFICWRIGIFIALFLPAVVQAQLSLGVTQIGIGRGLEDDGPTYDGHCTEDACRATLPVLVAGDICILNVHVGTPDAQHSGTILFATGPCRSGQAVGTSGAGYPTSARYLLGPNGAKSIELAVPFLPSASVDLGNDLNDGVVHPTAIMRLDIIHRP